MNKTCSTCKYFEPTAEECRYNPPTIIGYSMDLGDRGPIVFFPEVRKDHWCGKWEEHKPHEE